MFERCPCLQAKEFSAMVQRKIGGTIPIPATKGELTAEETALVHELHNAAENLVNRGKGQ